MANMMYVARTAVMAVVAHCLSIGVAPAQADRFQPAGRHLWGSNSSIRQFNCVGNRVSTSFRYAQGSCPLSLADCSRLITTAARSPASWLPMNNQLRRPKAQGLNRPEIRGGYMV
jgi:hypothetical protein